MKIFNYATAKIKNPTSKNWESIPALKGESAYETAIRLGTFTGTEKEWNDKAVTTDVIRDVLNNTPHVETISKFFDMKRTGKVYRTRIWLFATNPTSTGTKL